ncbi:MAG: hypothetical protein J7L11_07075 [Thermoprotei archaeon]|nr:hypothetical protein [Thermoprotei archaeon]
MVERPDLARKFGVPGVPCVLLITPDEKPIKGLVGYASPEELLKILKSRNEEEKRDNRGSDELVTAFLAGMLSILNPCTLPLMMLYLGFGLRAGFICYTAFSLAPKENCLCDYRPILMRGHVIMSDELPSSTTRAGKLITFS